MLLSSHCAKPPGACLSIHAGGIPKLVLQEQDRHGKDFTQQQPAWIGMARVGISSSSDPAARVAGATRGVSCNKEAVAA